MLANYKKKLNIATAVWLLTMIVLVVTIVTGAGQNIWTNPFSAMVGGINVIALWYAFWAYAKAKGYSGLVGIALPFLSIIGLIILALLKDKHPEPKSSKSLA